MRHEVIGTISSILKALDPGVSSQTDAGSFVVVINPTACARIVTSHALDLGWAPNREEPHEPFNPHDVIHEAHLNSFVQKDLAHALALPCSGSKICLAGWRKAVSANNSRRTY